eukprot:2458405-Prymnesium_polylepis.1
MALWGWHACAVRVRVARQAAEAMPSDRMDPAPPQAIVDEANLVFALNIEIFDELDGNPVQALWTLARKSLASALGLGN